MVSIGNCSCSKATKKFVALKFPLRLSISRASKSALMSPFNFKALAYKFNLFKSINSIFKFSFAFGVLSLKFPEVFRLNVKLGSVACENRVKLPFFRVPFKLILL